MPPPDVCAIHDQESAGAGGKPPKQTKTRKAPKMKTERDVLCAQLLRMSSQIIAKSRVLVSLSTVLEMPSEAKFDELYIAKHQKLTQNLQEHRSALDRAFALKDHSEVAALQTVYDNTAAKFKSDAAEVDRLAKLVSPPKAKGKAKATT